MRRLGRRPRARRVCLNADCNHMTYGLGEGCMLRPENLTYDEQGRASFTAVLNGEVLGDFHLNVPSEANMLDALAVICAATSAGWTWRRSPRRWPTSSARTGASS